MAEYTCIICPNSCLITVEEGEQGLIITGHKCKRGVDFAAGEHTNPTRILTSTMKLTGARIRRLPVITTGEVPKARLFECQKALFSVSVAAPVACGDVVVKDLCGTGVDVVATRSVSEHKEC
jgi:CxxC motif-containing protein